MKNLDAALRHLTYQTQRVAAGDFTQRVDFMGEFSEAYNSMVVALDKARTELGERNELLQAQTAKLEELATTDALTGAYNRRKFNRLILAEIARVSRYEHPLSLLILDIDHFKRVNDTHGHEAGDEVLVVLAGLIRAGIRATDSLARWGGEEFVVLSPEVTVDEAMGLAERLRSAAGSLRVFVRRQGDGQSRSRPASRRRDARRTVRARRRGALRARRKADATASRSLAEGSSRCAREPGAPPAPPGAPSERSGADVGVEVGAGLFVDPPHLLDRGEVLPVALAALRGDEDVAGAGDKDARRRRR